METTSNEPDREQCLRAVAARDARFDGRFFFGVVTTGVFCRPVCSVRAAKPANLRFFASAATALAAGFRPCLRCRPEAAPGTPAWMLTSAVVTRALRLIATGALDAAPVGALAARLGITPRHLDRLFQRHVGASPLAVAQARRLRFAKQLLDETTLPVTRIAYAAGYGSLRRCNAHFQAVYARSPTQLRRSARTDAAAAVVIRLAYREPFCWDSMLVFLARRAVPGVEAVVDGGWQRTIRTAAGPGWIRVEHDAVHKSLRCRLDVPPTVPLNGLADAVRALFDLDADPAAIHAVLRRDTALRPLVDRQPGLRVPGAWEAFETAVRAIVGQQVSVAGATTVMGRIAALCADDPRAPLLFPLPQRLQDADPADLPMPRARAAAILALARAVAGGSIVLDRWTDAAVLREQLLAIRGIGAWTANYIALRVLGDPDAFLHDDLVVRRVAARLYGEETPVALRRRAEAWRPWRAYAGMYLWAAAASPD